MPSKKKTKLSAEEEKKLVEKEKKMNDLYYPCGQEEVVTVLLIDLIVLLECNTLFLRISPSH